MKSYWIIPVAVTVAAAAGLYYYLPLGAGIAVDLREPGADQSAVPASAPAAKAGPDLGKLIRGKGKPSDLPGLWPCFRGPEFDGVSRDETTLAQSWPQGGPKAHWSVPMGDGYAGAAVAHGRVYVLDYDLQARGDALRCLSLADGSEIWRYFYPLKIKPNHGYSRTVPAVSGKYVVSLGPMCHVLCLDSQTGDKKWSMDLVERYKTKVPLWYAGQCPLVDGERVILAPAGPEALMIAVDCETGKVQWTTPNPMGWNMTHSCITPMVLDNQRMYVYFGSGGVAGVSADDGKLLWTTDAFRISTTVPAPVILPDGRIFCAGGYNAGSVMLQIKKSGEQYAVSVLFRLKPEVFGAEQATPIYYNGHIYGVRPSGELVCLDESGRVRWASEGENFHLGPLLIAQGMIYVLDDAGTLTLARASERGYERLARAKVLPGPEAWGPMAMVAGRLIVRDLRRMVCLDVARQPRH